MMKLSIMNAFLQSGDAVVDQALEKWGYDPESVRFMRASSTFIFYFERDQKKFILRLTPEGNVEQINQELAYLAYLEEKQLSVHQAYPSIAGNLVETLESSLGTFYATVFTFLEGEQYEMEDLTKTQFYLWGEALGELHKHSKEYKERGEYTLSKAFMSASDIIPESEHSARHELAVVNNRLESLKQTPQNFGRIHFDFELDNLIWKDGFQIVDFESSLDGWYCADIAFALRDLFVEKVELTDPSFQQFLQGYRSKTAITDEEIAHIPMFLRLHNLISFAKLVKTVDVERNPEHPEWLEGLRAKLCLKIEDYRSGFQRERERF